MYFVCCVLHIYEPQGTGLDKELALLGGEEALLSHLGRHFLSFFTSCRRCRLERRSKNVCWSQSSEIAEPRRERSRSLMAWAIWMNVENNPGPNRMTSTPIIGQAPASTTRTAIPSHLLLPDDLSRARAGMTCLLGCLASACYYKAHELDADRISRGGRSTNQVRPVGG